MDAQSYPFLIKNAVAPEVLDHVTAVTLLNWSRFKGNKTGMAQAVSFLSLIS